MSVVVDIAEAVVAALNAAELSLPFTAKRKMQVAEVALEDLKEIRLEVYPGPWNATRATRAGDDANTYEIMVGMQAKLDGAKLDADDYAEVDAMMDFTQEIHDLFRAQETLTEYEAASHAETRQERPYSEDDLREKHVFSSVLTLVFDVMRDA